jgi:hypothetical protein
VLQTVYTEGAVEGFGDIGLTSDKKALFGWMQYGWSAGLASSCVVWFSWLTGLLTFRDAGLPNIARYSLATRWNTGPGRRDNQTVFIKVCRALTPVNVSSLSGSDLLDRPEVAVMRQRSMRRKPNQTGGSAARRPVQTISSDYARLIYLIPAPA